MPPGALTLAADVTGPDPVVGLVLTASLFAGWALVGWDLWRRDDLDPGARVGWAVVAFLLAWIGIVAYWLFRPRGVTPGERARQQQASDDFVARHTRPPD